MTKALYRKYRPDSFEDFVSQNHVVDILNTSVEKNKISHAYIFFGPRGSGKTSAAKIFSELINCEKPIENKKCGNCAFCLSKGSENTDILEIDAASNNGVDQIREIKNNCLLLPNYGKYKVYIIDEVHMLSINAFNALLKILEEPPKHVIFIMATTEVNKVPLTVLSRSQRFDFAKIPVLQIKARLKSVSEIEKIKIDDESLELLSFYADGSLRDALGFLDQLSVNKKITLKEINALFGITDQNLINEFCLLIVNKEHLGVRNFLNKITQNNLNLEYFIKKVILYYENKMISAYDDYVELKKNNELLKKMLNIYNEVSKSKLPILTFECLINDEFFLTEPNEHKAEPTPNKAKLIKEVVEEAKHNIEHKETIINNALFFANKEEKKVFSKLMKENQHLFVKENLALINNMKVFAVGGEYIIFIADSTLLPQVNKKYKNILKTLNKLLNKETKIIFLAKEEGELVKDYYLKNRKTLKYIEILENKDESLYIFKEIIEEE